MIQLIKCNPIHYRTVRVNSPASSMKISTLTSTFIDNTKNSVNNIISKKDIRYTSQKS